ncbi:hypothetical protein E4U09_007585 [Claviceps aff. purpurea]|uniref:Uncharacterized protein n=1 Tax=Claviceps aff. purpurea TaxID=1967640 RepID=A0A9P7U2R6_9HYPO|nr:hypothetical protein E4U09_007585 [Claviceps aff. purpurea]
MTYSQEWGTIMETISLARGPSIKSWQDHTSQRLPKYHSKLSIRAGHRWHRLLDTDHVRDMKNVFGMDGPKRMPPGNRLLCLYNGADTARRYEVVRLKPLLASTPLANSILLGI